MSNACGQARVDAFVDAICDRDPFLDELGSGWRRSYGRLDPMKTIFATFVYENDDRAPIRIDVAMDHEQTGPGWRRWARRYDEDPSLRGLKRALTFLGEPTVVRYRPGKRCVIRGRSMHAQKIVYAKTFADQRAEALWRDALQLYEAGSQGRLGFKTAEPAWFDAPSQTIAHYSVAGNPIGAVLASSEGERLAGNLATALASIPRSGIDAPHRLGAAEQTDRTCRYLRRLARSAPDLSILSKSVLNKFLMGHVAVGEGMTRPIHGAPHLQQWLYDGSDFALVDFDRFSLGPPELDAATFIGELDFEPMDDALRNQLCASFLNAYEQAVGVLDRKLVALYRAHKHVAKAMKTSLAIRKDRITKARRILEGAAQLIDREIP